MKTDLSLTHESSYDDGTGEFSEYLLAYKIGNGTVYLREPDGLLNVNTGVAMPRSFLQAKNVRPDTFISPNHCCWLVQSILCQPNSVI